MHNFLLLQLTSVLTVLRRPLPGWLSVVPVLSIFFKVYLYILRILQFFNGNSLTNRLAPYSLFWRGNNNKAILICKNHTYNDVICEDVKCIN